MICPVWLSTLFVVPATGAQNSDSKIEVSNSQIDFFGERYEFLNHSQLKDGTELWEYIPDNLSVYDAKSSVIIFNFAKTVKMDQAIFSSLKADETGEEKILKEERPSNDEYYGIILFSCVKHNDIELVFEHYWQQGGTLKGVHCTKKFTGDKRKEYVDNVINNYLDSWFSEFKNTSMPQPWIKPPAASSPFIKRQIKELTKKGMSMIQGGDLNGLALLEKTIKLAPDDPIVYMNTGSVIAMLAMKTEGTGDKKLTINAFKKAEYYWNEALRRFDAQGGHKINHAQCLFQLGDTYEYIYGDKDKAAEYYKKALQLDQNNTLARVALEKMKK